MQRKDLEKWKRFWFEEQSVEFYYNGGKVNSNAQNTKAIFICDRKKSVASPALPENTARFSLLSAKQLTGNAIGHQHAIISKLKKGRMLHDPSTFDEALHLFGDPVSFSIPPFRRHSF